MFKAGDKVYVNALNRVDLPGVVTDVYGKHVLVRIEASYIGFDVDSILTFHFYSVRPREESDVVTMHSTMCACCHMEPVQRLGDMCEPCQNAGH